jgi:hypothetical protein
LLGHQCLQAIDAIYKCHHFFSEYVHHQNCHPPLSNCPGGHCSYLHQHTTSVPILHILSYMTQAWGMPASFVYSFYFSTPSERFRSHSFSFPSNGFLLQFLSTLCLTMLLSVEEKLMYFGYMYAPNLTHQGASVITEISSTMVTKIQHIQTISSFIAQKIHFQRAQTIQLVIKSACAQNIKEVCTCAPIENAEKAHMHLMHECVRKKSHTPQNDTFMILVGLPPTSGSAPKLI